MRLIRNQIFWDSIKSNYVIPLIANIFAAAITYFFTLSIVLVLIILFGGIFFFLALFWLIEQLFRHRLASVSIVDILPYSAQGRPFNIIPVNTRLKKVTKKFLFMGISARIFWDTDIFEMMKSHKYHNCSFQFLLLDPDSQALRHHLKQEEVTNIDAVQHDIHSFVKHVAAIKKSQSMANIQVKFYDRTPAFWFMLCDDILYVQTFPKGTIGFNSPLLIVKQEGHGERGFFEPFQQIMDDIWNYHSHDVPLI